VRRNPSRKYSVADLTATATQRFSQKDLAARLGVSTRTIRRWRNEGVQPADPIMYGRLKRTYDGVKRRIVAENKKIDASPPDIPIPLLGHRREVASEFDAQGRVVATAPSDWVNYDVTRVKDMVAWESLQNLRDRGATVQVIYMGEASPDYPSGRQGTSAIYLFPSMSDQQLRRLTLGSISYRRLLHIAVLDHRR
jgi:transposase